MFRGGVEHDGVERERDVGADEEMKNTKKKTMNNSNKTKMNRRALKDAAA